MVLNQTKKLSIIDNEDQHLHPLDMRRVFSLLDFKPLKATQILIRVNVNFIKVKKKVEL